MGSEIKGYSLLGKIAKGGMGEVYKAVHIGLNKEVILKKLSPKAPATFFERFRREATIMMDISHPNIVHMYDYFKDNGSSYIAMEYIAGYNLSEIVKKYGRLPVYLSSFIALEIAKGLQYAHQKGVIHRDIKPGNVLLSINGDVKLTDFGIAFKTDSHTSDNMTRTGTLLGTPAYMSPEQIQSSKDVDYQSDLYSLGILFYEMVTGKRPYENEFTVENLRKIRKGKYSSVKTYNKNVPYTLVKIISKLMHHDKRKRYKSSDLFISDISRFINSQFKDKEKIREYLSNVINQENTINLKLLEYPVAKHIIDNIARASVVFILLFLMFTVVKTISPGFIVTIISKDRYGIADFSIFGDTNKTDIDVSLISKDEKTEYKYHFDSHNNVSSKKNIILASDKYTLHLKYNNLLQIRDVIIKPYSVVRKNVVNIKIASPLAENINFFSNIYDAKTSRPLKSYKIFYKITGNQRWIEYKNDSHLKNGNFYDFSIYSNGYNPFFLRNVEITRWEKNFILNAIMTTKKVEVTIDVPPIYFDMSINGEIYGYEDKDFTRTVNLKLGNSIKSIYLEPGKYKMSFINKKNNILLEKEININDYNNLRITFVKDTEGDIFVVPKY